MRIKRGSQAGRAKLSTPSADQAPEHPAVALSCYTFEFPDHADFTINASRYGTGMLAPELLTALVQLHKDRGHLRYYTVKSKDSTIRVFVRDLQRHRPELESLADLLPADLDWWERELNKRHPTGRTAITRLTSATALLVEATATSTLREDLKYRLNRPSVIVSTESAPREGYTDAELTQIRELSLVSRQATVNRLITHRADTTLLPDDLQEVLRSVLAGPGFPALGTPLRNRLARNSESAGRVPLLVVPGSSDLLGLLILLALQTGWNPSTLLDLQADCLVNPTRGRVGVSTTKARRGERAHEVLYVRNDGPLSTGGLLRTVLELTDPLRQVTGKGDLWLWWSSKRGGVYDKHSLLARQTVKAFAAAHGRQLGEGGFPDLQVVRIRKSVKIREYKDAGGDLRAMAGHSTTVAARHYANLPEAADLHLGALRDALSDVLEVSSNSRNDSTSPEQDTFTTACSDSEHSPLYPAGVTCLADPSACFACPNSVISIRHLPRVLRHADQLAEVAQEESPDDWATTHGATWLSIHEGVLPQFSSAELDSARLQARDLLPLPLHVNGARP